uniref:Growth-regulating factor n=1 Tax=Plectus sambesii TaxID=2011161 RepID=A0A914W450_9BILA
MAVGSVCFDTAPTSRNKFSPSGSDPLLSSAAGTLQMQREQASIWGHQMPYDFASVQQQLHSALPATGAGGGASSSAAVSNSLFQSCWSPQGEDRLLDSSTPASLFHPNGALQRKDSATMNEQHVAEWKMESIYNWMRDTEDSS